jgi:hypothetical protein
MYFFKDYTLLSKKALLKFYLHMFLFLSPTSKFLVCLSLFVLWFNISYWITPQSMNGLVCIVEGTIYFAL